MCLLYELGLWSAKLFIRVTKAPDEEEAGSSDKPA
jgi:sec-independent protein translocase protein TatC